MSKLPGFMKLPVGRMISNKLTIMADRSFEYEYKNEFTNGKWEPILSLNKNVASIEEANILLEAEMSSWGYTTKFRVVEVVRFPQPSKRRRSHRTEEQARELAQQAYRTSYYQQPGTEADYVNANWERYL